MVSILLQNHPQRYEKLDLYCVSTFSYTRKRIVDDKSQRANLPSSLFLNSSKVSVVPHYILCDYSPFQKRHQHSSKAETPFTRYRYETLPPKRKS